MSVDQTLNRREAILERLFAIGSGDDLKSAGIATALRNPNPVPTGTRNGILGVPRPLFVLYDGDTRLTQNVEPHKIAKMPVTMWRMDPQIVILLEQRDNFENTILGIEESPIGPELSTWHDVLNNTITNDDQIIDLVTANGGHHLAGVTTSLKLGRDVGAFGAWLMMLYVFDYPLFPPR
jgi:hypothetical protein